MIALLLGVMNAITHDPIRFIFISLVFLMISGEESKNIRIEAKTLIILGIFIISTLISPVTDSWKYCPSDPTYQDCSDDRERFIYYEKECRAIFFCKTRSWREDG